MHIIKERQTFEPDRHLMVSLTLAYSDITMASPLSYHLLRAIWAIPPHQGAIPLHCLQV